MRSGWLGTGPRVAAFEKAFAELKNAQPAQVAAVNSCTAALHLSFVAAGLKAGDEVITSPLTFCATANAILHTGATPVLADVDPATMNIDPARIAEKIGPRTRAIVPVHFAGLPCDMDAIGALARKHELAVIEDCAHAVEALYRGEPTGTLGDFGCFSFYVTKNVTSGEGGMVLAKSERDAERIRMLALHGMTRDAWKRFSDEGFKPYQVVEAGFKYNMMDLQAAIGIHQLARVQEGWERRRLLWARYQQAFAALPVALPQEPPAHVRHGLHLYTLRIDKARCRIGRDDFLTRMTRAGIGVGVHYTALPEHPYYQQTLGWRPEDTPEATAIGRETVSLPLSPKLTEAEARRVIDAVHAALGA
ncbi:MAG: DegT/DnrJ/EryC1/StrS family aminotransferase [Ramlibacter sp.]|nr:DegT/DnrJ/EryC1/StrS family aminotransferase [Ramlibacter sp.]